MADSIFFLLKGLDDSFVGETFSSAPDGYFKTLIVYSASYFNDFSVTSATKLLTGLV